MLSRTGRAGVVTDVRRRGPNCECGKGAYRLGQEERGLSIFVTVLVPPCMHLPSSSLQAEYDTSSLLKLPTLFNCLSAIFTQLAAPSNP